MNKKIYYYFILFIILNSCGFEPMYKGLSGLDFKIQINSISGDRDLNNYLRSNLDRYSKINSDKIFILNLNSEYKKKIISKDSAGDATEYEIIANLKVTVNSDEILSYEEKIKIKKLADIFEQENYERDIKKSFANSLYKKIILKLSQENAY